ncbi:MAG: helix-turn-helix domain-containing protein [Oscillospiraceae bacterium]|nr:helix-turn-helix domain-containing protein [Oscillospiraceae bacterium]
MSEIAKTIGDRIRIYRVRAKITQMRLAEKSGVHHTYIGQLERGEKNATLETIEKVARALNLSLETLFEAIVDGNVDNTVSREIYDLVNAQPEKEQLALLELVKRAVEYKNI